MKSPESVLCAACLRYLRFSRKNCENFIRFFAKFMETNPPKPYKLVIMVKHLSFLQMERIPPNRIH